MQEKVIHLGAYLASRPKSLSAAAEDAALQQQQQVAEGRASSHTKGNSKGMPDDVFLKDPMDALSMEDKVAKAVLYARNNNFQGVRALCPIASVSIVKWLIQLIA